MEDQQSTEGPKSTEVITPDRVSGGREDSGLTIQVAEAPNEDGLLDASPSTPATATTTTSTVKAPIPNALMVTLRKLWILLWKNSLLRRRAWILLIFEIAMIGVVAGVVIGITGRPKSKGDKFDAEGSQAITHDEMIASFAEAFNKTTILYTTAAQADVQKAKNIIEKIERGLANIPSTITWTWVPPSSSGADKEIERKFNEAYSDPRNYFLCAIIFETLEETEVRYTIRMTKDTGVKESGGPMDSSPEVKVHSNTQTLFLEDSEPGPDENHARAYNESGILGLQILIDDAAIKELHTRGADGLKRKITLKTFPYPQYYGVAEDTAFQFFCLLFALVLFMSNAFLAMNIGSEKETGVKELMKLCGYPGWMQWLAWYLIPFFMDIILMLALAFALKWGPSPKDGGRGILSNTDVTLCFILFLLTKISNNAFVFFICSSIKWATLATAAAILVPVAIVVALSFALPKTYGGMMGCLILPHGCFVVAFKYIFAFEADDHGIGWSSLSRPLPKIPEMNVGFAMLFFLIDIVLYHCLAVYLESILPSDYGVRKPWYFPLQVFTCHRKKVADTSSQTSVAVAAPSAEMSRADAGFEPYQGLGDKEVGVDVQNLVKQFGKHKVSVNGVSVKMYDGEIFALLGHNGAGKTTLISMLSGMFAPTSGTARVAGFDITTDMDNVRKNLGLCPQHDMLFNNLTVMEHLKMFGQMKGQSASKVQEDALKLLEMMNLTEKKNTYTKKLSGGQKRKVCLGIALIGGAKVVILDEPTSGMDPQARRGIWDILLRARGERTIVLTTHFMEEADALGDRVGIMAEGKLQCYGTPSFLKSYFGSGYTLKVALFPGGHKKAILHLVRKHIPDASLKPIHMPNEIFIALPTEKTNSSALSALFSTLTQRKQEMRIESLGLSVASMDEIFVKVGELSGKAEVAKEELHDETKSSVRNSQISHKSTSKAGDDHDRAVVVVEERAKAPDVEGENMSGSPPHIPRIKADGCTVLLVQLLAILIKRLKCSMQKFGFLLFQLLVPALLMIWAVLNVNEMIVPETKLPPPLPITMEAYKNPKSLYSDVQNQIPSANLAMGLGTYGEPVNNVEDALKTYGASNILFFRENLPVAGEIVDEHNYTAWFNTIPLHAAPLAINLASNIRGRELDPPISFHVTNHPLKTKAGLKIDAALRVKTLKVGFELASKVSWSLLVVAICFVVLPTEERLDKSRQLQLMTGVHPALFWMGYYLWDFGVVLLISSFVILVAGILETFSIFSSNGGLGIIFLIFMAYGYTLIPLAYLVSYIPKSVVGGVIILLLFLLVSTVVAIYKESLTILAPITGIQGALELTGTILANNAMCNFLGDDEEEILCSPLGTGGGQARGCCDNCKQLPGVRCFSPQPFLKMGNGLRPGNGKFLVWTLIFTILCQLLHVIIELGVFRSCRSRMIKGKESDFLEQVDDEDVNEEKQRVSEMVTMGSTSSDALVVDTLCKNYGGFSAVSRLTFGVHHGECFGLLGTNGAGKTTTFRIITGDELKSLGDAYIHPFSLSRNRRKFISDIGYCPQFDAFVPYFSGKENLQLFARLRGIHWSRVDDEADKWLEMVGLTSSAHVKCKRYSGGMKRRLSAAIAMIGNPPLVLLDEPTSGVDPMSRRQFWKVVEHVKGSGQSIILTSHSMDECEALCARLGIMVNGQLQCIGGVQHLKHKFAQGYSLTLRLKTRKEEGDNGGLDLDGRMEVLDKEICGKFHPCMLKDKHETLLQYQIENTTIGWDVLYNTLEGLKNSYSDIIEDYSVGETTLEEVFLAFSRKQYPPRDSKIKLCKRIVTCQF